MERYFHYLKSLDKESRKELINACITYIVRQHNGENKVIQNGYEEGCLNNFDEYIRVSVRWENEKLILLLNDFDIRYYQEPVLYSPNTKEPDIYDNENLCRFYHQLMSDFFGLPYAKDFRSFCDSKKGTSLNDSYADLILRNRRLYSEMYIAAFINNESVFMIDIDGVILDTESRMREKAKELGWKEALATTDWHKHIYSSTPLADGLTILKEVTYPLKGRVFLISTSHSYDEEKEKINYFRDQGIILPIISVPPKTPKSAIVVPKLYLPSKSSTRANVFLIDDQEKNVDDWWNNGGHAILFTNEETTKPYLKVKSLDFLRQTY